MCEYCIFCGIGDYFCLDCYYHAEVLIDNISFEAKQKRSIEETQIYEKKDNKGDN